MTAYKSIPNSSQPNKDSSKERADECSKFYAQFDYKDFKQNMQRYWKQLAQIRLTFMSFRLTKKSYDS